MKTLLKVDPLSEERIRERRAFVLDFISAALFRIDYETARGAASLPQSRVAKRNQSVAGRAAKPATGADMQGDLNECTK